jgi:2-dehydro-3-deoxyphosphogluconate aldolase / (4S)-4-hydroxy-2-oxoglutarate aldolase
MKKHEVRGWIEETGIVAAIRVSSAEEALFAARATAAGGVSIVEITLTVSNAMGVISQLRKENPSMVIGAGGVGDVESTRQCLDAGAQFITSDGLHLDVTEFTLKQDVVVLPGALTPTEVIAAWKTGSDFVKVVPCVQIGGENYVRSLRRMFPHIPLIAAGGVSQQNASAFVIAGAIALGIGGELIPADAVRLRQADRIGELARRFVGFVKSGRAHLAARKSTVSR